MSHFGPSAPGGSHFLGTWLPCMHSRGVVVVAVDGPVGHAMGHVCGVVQVLDSIAASLQMELWAPAVVLNEMAGLHCAEVLC
jgi:hypothetical protein